MGSLLLKPASRCLHGGRLVYNLGALYTTNNAYQVKRGRELMLVVRHSTLDWTTKPHTEVMLEFSRG